jgi:hypothetical protein
VPDDLIPFKGWVAGIILMICVFAKCDSLNNPDDLALPTEIQQGELR